MRIEGHHRSWQAATEAELEAVLSFRDSVGGAQFWLSAADEDFPMLAVRISGDVGDVHFVSAGGHPGLRALASRNAPELEETILFRSEGADPATGEEVGTRFVLPFVTLVVVARDFFRQQSPPDSVSWFEL